jgi:CRISPR-associated protein Csm2
MNEHKKYHNNKQGSFQNRDSQNNPEDIVKIEWDKDDLFSEQAKGIAKKFADEKMNKHQLRKFYNEVLYLEKSINNNGLDLTIPYINMLNAKAIYAKSRKNCGSIFVSFIKISTKYSENKDSFMKFRKLFEAIVAYYG